MENKNKSNNLMTIEKDISNILHKKYVQKQKIDSPKANLKFMINLNISRKTGSQSKVSKELVKSQKNKSMIEESTKHDFPSARYQNKIDIFQEEKVRSSYANNEGKAFAKSKLVESVFGNVTSRNRMIQNKNSSFIKNGSLKMTEDQMSIKEVPSSNNVRRGSEESKLKNLSFINYSNLTKKNSNKKNKNLSLNSSQNLSLNNTVAKPKRCGSMIEETGNNDLMDSKASNFFISRESNDRTQIKDILKKILEETSYDKNSDKELINKLMPEIMEALSKKSKISTREDTRPSVCSGSFDSDTIENLHFMYVMSFQKYKKVVSNQENHFLTDTFYQYDQTVIKCEEVDF